MSKPLIGVMPLVIRSKGIYRITEGYMDALVRQGALPLMLPCDPDPDDIDQYVGGLDGFLFPGGPDIEPLLYGEARMAKCEGGIPERDTSEFLMLDKAISSGKPIFGVCRGCQVMNVAMGGTLYQDFEACGFRTDLVHVQTEEDGLPTHSVEIEPGTPLAEALGGRAMISVNSFHHQGIKKLGEGLKAQARATDGLVESFYKPGHRFYWGVQWHPELLAAWDRNSRALFGAFAAACRS